MSIPDSVIQEIARIVTSTLDINDVYEPFALKVSELLEFDRIYLNVLDLETGTLYLDHVYDTVPTDREPGLSYSPEGTQTQFIMMSRLPLIRNDLAEDLRFVDDKHKLRSGLRSSLAVPLISKGNIIGTFGLCSRRVGAYGLEVQAILERLGNLIAPSVEQASWFQRLQARTQEMALVDEVAQIITSTLDIDQVYQKFAQEMKKLVDFDRVSIQVIDHQNATYTLKYLAGPERPDRPVGSTRPLAGSQTEEVVLSGRSLVREDASLDSRFPTDEAQAELGMRACIAVPLLSKGLVSGAMVLRSRRVGAYGIREMVILDRLAKQIAPAIENARLYDRARCEKELANNTLAQLKAVLAGVDTGILLVDNVRHTLWANHKYGELFGLPAVESLAISYFTQEERRDSIRHTFADPDAVFEEGTRVYQDPGFTGATKEVVLVAPVKRILQPFTAPVYDENGSPLGRMWVYHDVTGMKMAEGQLLQFQKMEGIERLAGGIAHDFNNLLTAIMGYAQLAMLEAPAQGHLRDHVQEIQRAAERAANLTGLLLAFSRRQAIEPRVINLNDSIVDLNSLLRQLIGAGIELITWPGPDISPVKVDPTQLEQVLVNLVVNCRDAMPFGGKLTIETSMVCLEGQIANLSPGRYVVLSVTDTGLGMSEEVKAHLFEPFFTTKRIGKGTGLGLATCYGIVKQSGGHIAVSSELGQGTRVEVYLPSSTEYVASHPIEPASFGSPRGDETVPLAEDELRGGPLFH